MFAVCTHKAYTSKYSLCVVLCKDLIAAMTLPTVTRAVTLPSKCWYSSLHSVSPTPALLPVPLAAVALMLSPLLALSKPTAAAALLRPLRVTRLLVTSLLTWPLSALTSAVAAARSARLSPTQPCTPLLFSCCLSAPMMASRPERVCFK
jgi:hypothetical protein